MEENKNLQDDFTKSKRFMLNRLSDNANLNPMQKAFVECVDAVKKDIEKRRMEQS